MYLIYCACSCTELLLMKTIVVSLPHVPTYPRVMCELMPIQDFSIRSFFLAQRADLSKTCLFENSEHDLSQNQYEHVSKASNVMVVFVANIVLVERESPSVVTVLLCKLVLPSTGAVLPACPYAGRPNLLPCRSALFLTGNSKESSNESTATSRPNCSTCGTNTRPTNGQPSGCWNPALTWMHRGTRPINQTNKNSNGSFRSHQIK